MKFLLFRPIVLIFGVFLWFFPFSIKIASKDLKSSFLSWANFSGIAEAHNQVKKIYDNTVNNIIPFSHWQVFNKKKLGFVKANPEIFRNLKDKRIAIVVHGLAGNASDFKHIARFLSNYKQIDPLTKNSRLRYDFVLAYDYNTVPGIKKIAIQFAKDVRPFLLNTHKIDLFGHSLGGLVCRWALEKEGLGKQINKLVTLGTPHQGVPIYILQPILAFLPTSYLSVSDLTTQHATKNYNGYSNFLKLLNHGYSPYKEKAEYYTLAGNSHTKYMHGLGNLVHKLYTKHLGHTMCDGLVAEYSANSPLIGSKSLAWKNNYSYKRMVVLNHVTILGSPDHLLPQSIVTGVLKDWMQNWALD